MSKAFIALCFMLIAGRQPVSAQDLAPQKELVQYVRDARKAGMKDPQIHQNAEKAGWPASAVTDAIAYATAAPATAKEAAKPNAADDKAAGPTSDKAPAPSSDTTAASASDNAAPDGSGPAAPAAGVPVGSNPAATVTAPVSGVPNPAIKQQQQVSRGVPDDYQIGSGDVLHVNVWGEPTASVNGAVVRPDGKISLPLIHEIAVLGLTTAQTEKAIADQLGRFINNPDVAVIVAGINSKKIYVTGAVKKEGTIPFTYRMTVMQALSEAGGLTPYAKKRKIYVLRNEGGIQYKLDFDYQSVLKGEHMEMNRQLQPGDQIIVP